MKTLTLTVKEMPAVGLEAETIKPESVAGKKMGDVAALIVYAGKRKLKLGDVFELKGELAKEAGEQAIVVEKSTAKLKRIGEAMGAGEITVKGDVGYHLGEFMCGGKITVEGNAGSWVGTNMEGGEIVITGNAGSYVGCSARGVHDGMKAGRITVKGNVGTEVGVGLAGGEITVEGRVEDFCGSYMRGGIIRVGGTGQRPSYAMSGGEIVISDRGYRPPLYFTKSSEDNEYALYEGDSSFGGKGKLRIKKK